MKIVTHSGPFHCDDVFAVALVIKTLGEHLEVTRTRDEAVLEEAKQNGDILLDVGGSYDGKFKFDHHFVNPPTRPDGTPYASAGLVAKYLEVNAEIEQLCMHIDFADNGLTQKDWTLSLTVHKCNPLTGRGFDERFLHLTHVAVRSLKMAEIDGLREAVEFFEDDPSVKMWVKEHDDALEASTARIRVAFGQDSGASTIVLDQYEPALLLVAHEAPAQKLYTIFPNPAGEWMVQQIPLAPKSPQGRKPLPDLWAGKRGKELDDLTGLSGCVFVHHARFVGAHQTKEGAIKLAELAAAE